MVSSAFIREETTVINEITPLLEVAKEPIVLGVCIGSTALAALALGNPIGAVGGALVGGVSYLTARPVQYICEKVFSLGSKKASLISKIIGVAAGFFTCVGVTIGASAVLGNPITFGSACLLTVTSAGIGLGISIMGLGAFAVAAFVAAVATPVSFLVAGAALEVFALIAQAGAAAVRAGIGRAKVVIGCAKVVVVKVAKGVALVVAAPVAVAVAVAVVGVALIKKVHRSNARSDDLSNASNSIDQGATFIAKELLKDVDGNTVNLFREMDPGIFSFLLTKAAFIYTIGSRRNEPLPEFFKPETRGLIASLRNKYQNKEFIDLEKKFKKLSQFELEIKDEDKREVFNNLRIAGAKELQGGKFITDCYQKALKKPYKIILLWKRFKKSILKL